MPSARKSILNRIEAALYKRVDLPFPSHHQVRFAFPDRPDDLIPAFTTAFTALDGHLIRCKGEAELVEKIGDLANTKQWTNIHCRTPTLMEALPLQSFPWINRRDTEADAGLTDCECLVARSGSVVLSASQASGRVLPIYSPVHLIVASTQDIVFDIEDAISLLKKKYRDQLPSGIFFASGPSRTADIEKKLVLGVHGPKEVYLFLMENELT